MFNMPAFQSDADRSMDIDHVYERLHAAHRFKIPLFDEALQMGQEMLKNNPAINSINVLTVQSDGEHQLINITRENWRIIWNFGKPN